MFIIKEKKSHTCEKGGAQLRISFSHLLTNFEKPEKSEFWKNEEKKIAGDIIILLMCTKKTYLYEVQFLQYGVRQRFCHFMPFFALLPPPPPKTSRDVITLTH